MASLKRYRQANDSNAAARFRDLPPRFKRQKSVPSPEDDIADCHKQNQSYKPKKLSQGEAPILPGSTAINSALSQESSKDKKMLKKGSGNRPFLNVDHNNVRRATQPIVLSPMDNWLFDLDRNDTQDSQGTANINPFSWQNQQQTAWPRYTNEQATFMSSSNNGAWTFAPNVPETNQYVEPGFAPPKDYSETDRRIIEMFKELERVADQKEKEETKNGTDRKSLVSHHLRMLMCAMDKYTEGIEDEETSSSGRDQEVPQGSRSPSPPVVEENLNTSVPFPIAPHSQQSAQCSTEPVFPTSLLQTIPPIQSCQFNHVPVIFNQDNVMPQHVHHVTDSFSHGKAFEFSSNRKPCLPPNDERPWNLWSSPSFNGLDVYNYFWKGHNSSETADSTFVLFDKLGMENDYSPRAEDYLARTPLYKR